MRGNLLNKPKKQGSAQEASEGALEYRHQVEQDLTAKLNSTLEPLVGAGRFRAAVSAECDLASGEQSEENYDPTHSVMVSSQKTEDVSQTAHAAGGQPGTASNLPNPPSNPMGGGGTSRKTESINYQTSHMVKHTITPQGSIKKLSVSVLIDHDIHWEGTAPNQKKVLVAPTPERIKSIHDLVAAAAGLDTARGDQLIVESLPFESTLNLEPMPPAGATKPVKPLTALEQLKSDPKMMYGLIGVALLVLVGGFFAVKSMLGKKPYAPPVQIQQALPAATAEGAGQNESWSPSALAGGGKPALAAGRVETLTNQLRGAAQKDAEVVAGVLRGWIKGQA